METEVPEMKPPGTPNGLRSNNSLEVECGKNIEPKCQLDFAQDNFPVFQATSENNEKCGDNSNAMSSKLNMDSLFMLTPAIKLESETEQEQYSSSPTNTTPTPMMAIEMTLPSNAMSFSSTDATMSEERMSIESEDISENRIFPVRKEMDVCTFDETAYSIDRFVSGMVTGANVDVGMRSINEKTEPTHKMYQTSATEFSITEVKQVPKPMSLIFTDLTNECESVPDVYRVQANAVTSTYPNISALDNIKRLEQVKVKAIMAKKLFQAATIRQLLDTGFKGILEPGKDIKKVTPSFASSQQHVKSEHPETMTSLGPFNKEVTIPQWTNIVRDGNLYAENVLVPVLSPLTNSDNDSFQRENVDGHLTIKPSPRLNTRTFSVAAKASQSGVKKNTRKSLQLTKSKPKQETVSYDEVAKTKKFTKPFMKPEKLGGTYSLVAQQERSRRVPLKMPMEKEINNWKISKGTRSSASNMKKLSITIKRYDAKPTEKKPKNSIEKKSTTTSNQGISSAKLPRQENDRKYTFRKAKEQKTRDLKLGSSPQPSFTPQSGKDYAFSAHTLPPRSIPMSASVKDTGNKSLTNHSKSKPTDNLNNLLITKPRKPAVDTLPKERPKRFPNFTNVEMLQIVGNESLKEAPKMSVLSQWMDMTFIQRKILYGNPYNNVARLVEEYPALRCYKIVKEEFGRLLNDKDKMKMLEGKLVNDLTQALNLKSKSQFQVGRDHVWQEARQRWKNTPNCPLEMKKVLGMLCFAYHFAENEVNGSLFRLRKEGEKPDAYLMVTPTLDIRESEVFETNTQMWIYLDTVKYLKVPNIYEGVLCMYAIYWMLNIKYSSCLKDVFEYFDAIVGNPQTSYRGDILQKIVGGG